MGYGIKVTGMMMLCRLGVADHVQICVYFYRCACGINVVVTSDTQGSRQSIIKRESIKHRHTV